MPHFLIAKQVGLFRKIKSEIVLLQNRGNTQSVFSVALNLYSMSEPNNTLGFEGYNFSHMKIA